MPQNDLIESLVRELASASESGAIFSPLPSSRPGFDLDAAYAVEAGLKRLRESHGHLAVGRKVGYANKAAWRILKLDTLVWAHMYDDTVRYFDSNAAALSIAHHRSLKIEPEIVFGLKRPILAENLDASAALEHVDWLALGFEIIDCPYPDWQFQPADFVASYGLHAALIVGQKISVTPQSIPDLVAALARFTVRVSKNGEFVEQGSGKNSLRSPALCLAEFSAAILRRFPGQPLTAGEIISSGTLTAGHLTQSGDRWLAQVEGIGLPALSLKMD